MRLLWLPEVLRAAGLTVHEVSGWRGRGSERWGPIRGLTCHHTAGSRTSTDEGEIRTLLTGSSSAPAPIAQLYLSRTGAWYVVASGMCFHNLVGWGGPNRGFGNASLIGVEAQHSGGTEPWTPVQYQSYTRGVAALLDRLGLPAARAAGHREHQPGAKFDPTFDLHKFRADVARHLNHGEDDDDMKMTDIVYYRTEPDGKTKTPRTMQNCMGSLDVLALRAEGRESAEAHQITALEAKVDQLGAALARIEAAVGGGSAPIRPGQ